MSISEGRSDLEKRIGELHKMLHGEQWKEGTRYLIKIGDALTGGLGMISEAAGALSEVCLGSADMFADARLRRANIPARLKVAGMFHDARSRFGWNFS